MRHRTTMNGGGWPGVLLLLAAMLASSPAWAGKRLEVIELQGRPAQEVIPLIRPFLRPGDGISGSGFTLMLRSDPDTLAQVRQMLDGLDQAPVNLMISVRHGHVREGSERYLGGRGAVGVIDGDVRGGVVVRGHDQSGDLDAAEVSRVRALTGEPVFLRSGVTVTRPYDDYRVGPDGVRGRRGYATEDLTGGFYATVQLQPDGRVRVELATRDVHPRAGGWGRTTAGVQGVGSVVTGRLGEWIPIGGVGRSYRGDSRGLLHSGSASGSGDDSVSIRVERLD